MMWESGPALVCWVAIEELVMASDCSSRGFASTQSTDFKAAAWSAIGGIPRSCWCSFQLFEALSDLPLESTPP